MEISPVVLLTTKVAPMDVFNPVVISMVASGLLYHLKMVWGSGNPTTGTPGRMLMASSIHISPSLIE